MLGISPMADDQRYNLQKAASLQTTAGSLRRPLQHLSRGGDLPSQARRNHGNLADPIPDIPDVGRDRRLPRDDGRLRRRPHQWSVNNRQRN